MALQVHGAPNIVELGLAAATHAAIQQANTQPRSSKQWTKQWTKQWKPVLAVLCKDGSEVEPKWLLGAHWDLYLVASCRRIRIPSAHDSACPYPSDQAPAACQTVWHAAGA